MCDNQDAVKLLCSHLLTVLFDARDRSAAAAATLCSMYPHHIQVKAGAERAPAVTMLAVNMKQSWRS